VPPGFEGLPPRVIGHRGAAGLAPENTLVSFHRARADGADVLELDVHATADGEIVVLHDAALDRTTDGTGPVRARSWDEVRRLDAGRHFTADGGRTFPYRDQGAGVPRLVDLIAALPTMPLNIEIKQGEPPIVDAVVDIVRAAAAPIVLAAEHDSIMHAIRAAAPELPTSVAAGEMAAFHEALDRGETPVLPKGVVALQIPPRFGDIELVTAASIATAHALGVEVHVWTINDPAEIRRLLALGCDGVVSDFPARVRAAVDGRGRGRAGE
jgi:glycerophosphoryl diester phosphodiesterase